MKDPGRKIRSVLTDWLQGWFDKDWVRQCNGQLIYVYTSEGEVYAMMGLKRRVRLLLSAVMMRIRLTI